MSNFRLSSTHMSHMQVSKNIGIVSKPEDFTEDFSSIFEIIKTYCFCTRNGSKKKTG